MVLLFATAATLAAGAVAVPPAPIIGGDEVGACGWPSVVALEGTCSGTLVHPQVVLYAAHCGPNVHFVTPGEVEVDGTPVAAECVINPDWDHMAGGNDYAVCVLDAPIEGVPIVPILMGCEHDALAPGVLATSVGFGLAPDGPAGIKRAVTYAIDGVALDEGDVWIGGADGSLCDGDSGGGAFVQLPDGSWRLFGVHSAVAGEPCTDAKALLTLASGAVPWIEAHTGLDVTPCHDADGTWNPGPDCGGFPLDPATGGGAWPRCQTGPLGAESSSCAPPPDDDTTGGETDDGADPPSDTSGEPAPQGTTTIADSDDADSTTTGDPAPNEPAPSDTEASDIDGPGADASRTGCRVDRPRPAPALVLLLLPACAGRRRRTG